MVVYLENIRGSLIRLNQKNSVRWQYIKLTWPHIHSYQLILVMVGKTPFTIATKKVKYLGINLIVQKLYDNNFLTFLKISGRLE